MLTIVTHCKTTANARVDERMSVMEKAEWQRRTNRELGHQDKSRVCSGPDGHEAKVTQSDGCRFFPTNSRHLWGSRQHSY